MKKDSLVIFSLSALLSLGIVGGLYYFHLQRQQLPPYPAVAESLHPINTDQPKGHPVVPANHRTDTPIKCTKPDGSVFWTNAARCEGADLDNRLSYADPVKPAPRVRIDQSHSKRSNGGSSGVSSPAIKTMKSIPRELRNQRSFPIGMARKIETRSLSLKSDPSESLWKDSYCRWVCEARVENCVKLEEYLDLVSLCPRRPFMSKRSCGT